MTALATRDVVADFIERAAAGLSPDPPGPDDPTSNPGGDHVLDPDGSTIAPVRPYRPAAVLVPVTLRENRLAMLFTVRSAHLRDHSGQIAFPGGKIDPSDATPERAALREAQEEIGLHAGAVRVLGYLDPYLSATGFLVIPVVGYVDPDAGLTPNPHEVADVFAVPLDHLMDPSRHSLGTGTWQGRTRRYYAITFGERLIWGVTAGIVHNLYERLSP